MLSGFTVYPRPTYHRGHIRKPFFSLKNDFEIKTDLEKDDVCNSDVRDSMMIKNHCKQKGIISHYTLTMGGKQNIKFIDEPNLYRVIFGAKVENAAMFQDWVFEEVLPTIRKTGK